MQRFFYSIDAIEIQQSNIKTTAELLLFLLIKYFTSKPVCTKCLHHRKPTPTRIKATCIFIRVFNGKPKMCLHVCVTYFISNHKLRGSADVCPLDRRAALITLRAWLRLRLGIQWRILCVQEWVWGSNTWTHHTWVPARVHTHTAAAASPYLFHITLSIHHSIDSSGLRNTVFNRIKPILTLALKLILAREHNELMHGLSPSTHSQSALYHISVRGQYQVWVWQATHPHSCMLWRGGLHWVRVVWTGRDEEYWNQDAGWWHQVSHWW